MVCIVGGAIVKFFWGGEIIAAGELLLVIKKIWLISDLCIV